MSWLGTHYTDESEEALRCLTRHQHCKQCKYKARIQWDHRWWLDHTCHRCGMMFPATKINDHREWHDFRIRNPEPVMFTGVVRRR